MHPYEKVPICHNVSNQTVKVINGYERQKGAFFVWLKDICSEEYGNSNLKNHIAVDVSTS